MILNLKRKNLGCAVTAISAPRMVMVLVLTREYVMIDVQFDLRETITIIIENKSRLHKNRYGDNVLQVKYENKWLEVARTDLMGQDHASVCFDTDESLNDALMYHKNSVLYGSYIKEDAFYIIDSMTDG